VGWLQRGGTDRLVLGRNGPLEKKTKILFILEKEGSPPGEQGEKELELLSIG